MKLTLIINMVAILVGCVSVVSCGDDKTNAIVSLSAQGWSLKPGPPENVEYTHPSTIIVNPKGEEFNIGTTQYPDFLPATLWIVEVVELQSRFLLIRVPPTVSGSVPMPVMYLDGEDRPALSATIQQRWEFSVCEHDTPGFNPKIVWDGEHSLRDILFEDIDNDNVPELKEFDVWKWGGTITHYRLTNERQFAPVRIEKRIHDQETQLPLWIEIWAPDKTGQMKLLSREKAPEPS